MPQECRRQQRQALENAAVRRVCDLYREYRVSKIQIENKMREVSNGMSEESSDLRQKCLDVESGFLKEEKFKKQVKSGILTKFKEINELLDTLN